MPLNSPPNNNGSIPRHGTATNEPEEGEFLAGTSPLGRTTSHSLAGSYSRTGFFTMGSRGTVVPHPRDQDNLTEEELNRARQEERSLLADNDLIMPSGSAYSERREFPKKTDGLLSQALRSSSGIAGHHGEEAPNEPHVFDAEPTENTSLLPSDNSNGKTYNGKASNGKDSLGDNVTDGVDPIDKQWEDAVVAGLIHTTWQREAKVLTQYTMPLMVTFILQYSLTVASIFTVGHLGKVELASVSLASMTANITGYAIYQGLSTSLDTLCAQAYGSGNKKLVGLHMQRMICFLWLITIPIGILWVFSERILTAMVPDPEVAALAGLYMKVVTFGAPGVAAFEASKRYVTAQGLFSAPLYVLLVAAPLNILMNWGFVWKLKWGFIGAPIAVAITDNLLPFFLFIYVYFFTGRDCWNGFTPRAFQNWGPMIRLALPGFLMVEAEVLAFEILTLAAAYFGTTALAAQSVLSTIAALTFQVPFPLSIAGSTRIANLIGATLTDAAKTAAKVNMVGALIVGVVNVILLSSLRNYIPHLFTSDEDVAKLIAAVLPLCASFQLFDAIATNCNGILRGLGRQSIGGYVQLISYYCVAIPISMATGFGLKWHLWGLWGGVAIGLFLVSAIEIVFLLRADWERSVEDARKRNASA
ncbi:hypothetical protein FQN57_004159 [Myotisia sp. PD_48]|nr:hypothetical protein FQN57_004159 [Myotisia sp. PD_48]